MPHYKNGREAVVGDRVVGRGWDGNPFAGVVVSVVPGAMACNMNVLPMRPQDNLLVDCEKFNHVDDVMPIVVPTAATPGN